MHSGAEVSMRICSIITTFTSGGAEVLVRNMATEFVRAGQQASVLALCDASSVGNSAETEQLMVEHLKQAGVTARSLGLGRRRGMLAGARALRKALAELRPDIVHAHTARAVLMLRLAGVRVPVILTHHNSRLSFPPRLFAIFDSIVSAYVAISAQCAEIARQHARRPVQLIENGADARFRAPHARSRPADHSTIIAVGTATEQKDYPTLIRSAQPLKRLLAGHGRSAMIRIVGGGALLPDLQSLSEDVGGTGIVELLGPRHDVPELLASADLFANSSLYEGMPIAMLEALSAALPIVATRVAGNTELVEDGINGLLVPGRDPEALAKAIASILLDESLYRSFSEASLEKSAAYTLEGCAAAHLDLYERLTGASGQRQAA
jgi:glycosyltransferase involved in cell wall biosynthesis